MLLDFFRRLLSRRAPEGPLAEMAGSGDTAIRVVVGLGNPGERYAATRHNVGFMCVDVLAARIGSPWSDDRRRTQSLLAIHHGEVPLVLVKPQTYMNSSGETVRAIVGCLAIESSQVLVVYDDMDLALGSLRLRERGSAGTHNGMRSVLACLETTNVSRLRIGIGQARRGDGKDYVLSPFGPDEEADAASAVERAAAAALAWATEGAAAAMNRFNS